MFNFIDIYSFIPVSDFVGRGPSSLLYPVAYYAVNTTLTYTFLQKYEQTCGYEASVSHLHMQLRRLLGLRLGV